MITRKLVVVALVAMMSAPLAAHAGGGNHHDSGSHHSGGKHHGGGKHGGKHDKDFCDPKPITEVHGHSVKELYSLFRKFIEEHYS